VDQELTQLLEKETKPIIESARDRLNENFNVNLSLPIPNLDSKDINFNKPSIKHNTRWIDQGYETQVVKKKKWYYLWVFSDKETIQVKRPDKKENYYTVSVLEIVNDSNKNIEQKIQHLKQGIKQYLEDDFKDRLDNFFEDLNIYLSSYCGSLAQAQIDQKLNFEEKRKLVEEFNYLRLESKSLFKELDKHLQRIDYLMRNK
jgi:hypothetical protein